MSESEGEQTARSIALEQVYVHEVYEQCAEKTAQNRHWPKIYKFLEELEPGALVCDIGCGNGKYLSINNNIFQVGADKCKKFTDIARRKNNEVLICDNLALPFRDESFDAVLSIAVVHHFATTERRVNALRELARVLRIGGKLVISVWAMEQRHRKFESQDVLIPWPKAYCLNATCYCGTKIPCDDEQRCHLTRKSILPLKREQQKYKCRRYRNDPFVSSSPSTSSLSSPNETCYSFFRRALQKLAGKRSISHRPWFFDSFHNISCKNRHHEFDSDDNSDVDDIPIELRRLEDEHVRLNKLDNTFGIKSKSLGDILEIQHLDLVRSRSSIPDLWSTAALEEEFYDRSSLQNPLGKCKSRFIKQKNHCLENNYLEKTVQITDNGELNKNLPELQANSIKTRSGKHPCIFKQLSMNEELMSMERLAERDYVRHKFMKQMSLNEDIICKNITLDKIEDNSSLTARRFQILKSGLTNRIKRSTTNMDKVSPISFKNGLVKIFQNWKSLDSSFDDQTDNKYLEEPMVQTEEDIPLPVTFKKEPEVERCLSKEDGSDSSKDSSLQSDTSLDSEDSFASVIYVPKKQISPVDINAMPSVSHLRTTSAPPSPRVKHPPDLHKPKIKIMSILPLSKQFPAASKSLPPPSPPGLSPKTFNSFITQSFFHQQNVAYNFDKLTNKQSNEDPTGDSETNSHSENIRNSNDSKQNFLNLSHHNLESSHSAEENDSKTKVSINKLSAGKPKDYSSPSSLIDDVPILDNLKTGSESNESLEKSHKDISNDEDSRKCRLNEIKELLQQKPGFATRCSKPSFPLVRRASTATTGRLEAVAKTLPRLLSLELFNPETDDLDSDSSGVSSPDSVDSIVSVISDERRIDKFKIIQSKQLELSKKLQNPNSTAESVANTDKEPLNESIIFSFASSTQSLRIREPPAELSSSVGNSADQIGSRSESEVCSQVPDCTESSKSSLINDNLSNDRNWKKKSHENLINFSESIAENFFKDIDQFCQQRKLELLNDITSSSKIALNSDHSSSQACDRKLEGTSNSDELLVDNTVLWLKNSIDEFSKSDNKLNLIDNLIIKRECQGNECLYGISSEDTMGFVIVSKNGEVEENKSIDDKFILDSRVNKNEKEQKVSTFSNFLEPNDEDSDNFGSSQTIQSSPTTFLESNDKYKHQKDKRICQYNERLVSEEMVEDNNRTNAPTNDDYSESSSQESLLSEREGGAITYHQYYHVFREGELDQLINTYVENLHIISSYYDHANWCIVAEKVQVWTI
ncbi:uncharacterized protein LOC103570226 [Microplitis demolitor]|uniref:uncharacterized protein LOC103570226 n=1 Tax=Microplitis demolitor TaxID=69319 RepID=UPI0004CD4663|nr:uncharacterized protein LOC103570226 [Microplitis demolitor]